MSWYRPWADGYCLLDFWLVWTEQYIQAGKADKAAEYATKLAHWCPLSAAHDGRLFTPGAVS